MAINFKEIAIANTGDGDQDTFELFTRDFLELLGFEILQHPGRGADGGIDLIVNEVRTGIGGKSSIKWLVSCKHFAHTGKSVSHKQEPSITDRVKANSCDGFMGVYSTLPSSALNNMLKGCKDFEFLIYDYRAIERKLLESPEGIKLARRYFPRSTDKHIIEHPKPANTLGALPELRCSYCGQNLLPKADGVIASLISAERATSNRRWVQDIYFSCKGDCDARLQAYYKTMGLIDRGWCELRDYMTPRIYLQRFLEFIRWVKSGTISKKAVLRMQDVFTSTFPYIAREMTEDETERTNSMLEFEIL